MAGEKETRHGLDLAFGAIKDLTGLAFTISNPREPDNPIVYASPSFCSLTGYSEDEVIGRNCRFLQHPPRHGVNDTDQRAVMELRDAVREERGTHVVLLNYRKDGTPFYNCLSIFPIRDEDTDGRKIEKTHFPAVEGSEHGTRYSVKYYLGVQTDVTNLIEDSLVNRNSIDEIVRDEEVKAQKIFREMRDRSALIAAACSPSCAADESVPSSLLGGLAGIHACFVLSDPNIEDNPMVFCSPEFLELTGYTAEELLGRNCRMLQGPDTDKGEVERIRAALGANPPKAVTATLVNYRKNGEKFLNRVHISPVRDSDGKVQFFVGVQYEVAQLLEHPENQNGEGISKSLTPNFDSNELFMISMKQKSVIGSVRVAARALSCHGLRRRPEDQLPI